MPIDRAVRLPGEARAPRALTDAEVEAEDTLEFTDEELRQKMRFGGDYHLTALRREREYRENVEAIGRLLLAPRRVERRRWWQRG